MQIGFVAQPFDRMSPPVRGGSLALWIYYMARLCAARGHRSLVVANYGGALNSSSTEHDGVRYIYTPTGIERAVNKALRIGRAVLRNDLSQDQRIPAFASRWHHVSYACEAAWTLRTEKCDVVHIMNYSQFAPFVRTLHPKSRVVLHMQCEWLTQLDASIIEPRLKATDLVVGCSEYITQKIASKFPQYADRCVTVPNAADIPTDDDEKRSDGREVVFVGRLSPEKGIHDLIRAFHEVLRHFPDARLRLVGGPGIVPLEFLVGLSDEPYVAALKRFYLAGVNGSKHPYIEALEKEAGQEMGKRIIFEGVVGHDQIEKAYRSAAVVVNPSLSESFGISVIEAMMRRIPVVATRIGGMTTTLIDGVTGIHVDPANPPALADAICQLLSNPEQARAMGEAGRERAVERYSWESVADRYLDCLRG